MHRLKTKLFLKDLILGRQRRKVYAEECFVCDLDLLPIGSLRMDPIEH